MQHQNDSLKHAAQKSAQRYNIYFKYTNFMSIIAFFYKKICFIQKIVVPLQQILAQSLDIATCMPVYLIPGSSLLHADLMPTSCLHGYI